MDPAPPAGHSAPPPGAPTRPGGSAFRRGNVVVESGANTIGAAPPPPRLPPSARRTELPSSPSDDEADEYTYESSGDESQHHPDAVIPMSSPLHARSPKKRVPVSAGGEVAKNGSGGGALSAAAIDRVFGATGSEERPKTGGSGGASPGLMVRPTTKEGNDSVSMYSMSQSVLPLDPRDRLYYRPRRHLLQCYVKRKKEGNAIRSLLPLKSFSCHYYLEHTNDFVLAARQGPTKSVRAEDLSDGVAGRSYQVSKGLSGTTYSISAEHLDKDPRGYVGKTSARGKGSTIVMFSEGSKATRKEICAILFRPPQDGQRRFFVLLPAIDEETGYLRPLEGGQVKFLRDGRGTTLYGTAGADAGSRGGIDAALQSLSDEEVTEEAITMAPDFTPTGQGQFAGTVAGGGPAAAGAGGKKPKWRTDSLLVREFYSNPRSTNIIVLANKPARWDSTLRGYQQDFHGRATKASEKNFQLVPINQPEKVVMLFGKQGGDRYAVDYRYPLCGLQAAGIATTMMGVNYV